MAIGFGQASAEKVTYALAVGETHASGDVVSVKNGDEEVATLTFGEAGEDYADFKEAKANAAMTDFVAFTEGNGVNGNKAGGTFYTIVPKYDGTVTIGVCLNADKGFYVEEDGTALAQYNGIKVTEKYYGPYEFAVKAGSSYKFYCAGSKLGFYGFVYTYEVGGDDEPGEDVDPVELCAIDPAPGLYDVLPTEWVITYGGKKLSVNEDAEVKLVSGDTEYPLYIMLDEEDDTRVIVSFDGRPLTTPGEWVIEIPENTISIEGTPIADPQSFKYTVKSPYDYTIDPAEGTVSSLQRFTITFNNYMVELNEEEVGAFLFNTETEGEVEASVVEVIAGGKALYVELPNEVTEPGTYQLVIMDATVKNMKEDKFLPALAFDYNVTGVADGIGVVKTNNQKDAIFNLQGQRVKNAQKGLFIVNGKKVVK